MSVAEVDISDALDVVAKARLHNANMEGDSMKWETETPEPDAPAPEPEPDTPDDDSGDEE